jgi:hypothetical protein
LKSAKQINKMEDCTVTTETIGEIHHTYYSRDGAIVAECLKIAEYGRNTERRYRHGKLHREDGPAEILYENGQKIIEYWYHDGKWHRDDGPAVIAYKDGRISGERWCRYGEYHRDDGPAIIWYENGQKTTEFWYRDDKLYPIGVLASVMCHTDDPTNYQWVGGRPITDIDEFRDKVKGDAIHEALRLLPIPIRDAIIPHYCYQ